MGGNHASAAAACNNESGAGAVEKRHVIHNRRHSMAMKKRKAGKKKAAKKKTAEEALAPGRSRAYAPAAIASLLGAACLGRAAPPRKHQHCNVLPARRAPQSETLALRGLKFQLYRWPGEDPQSGRARARLGRYQRDLAVRHRPAAADTHLGRDGHARLRTHAAAGRRLLVSRLPRRSRCVARPLVAGCAARSRRAQHGRQHRDAVRGRACRSAYARS